MECGPLQRGDLVLDRYRVRAPIGEGGYSVVYRGHDDRLARPVCIKVFQRAIAEDGIRKTAYQHFVQEAFALSRLRHPNTLRIYDFGHLPARAGGSDIPIQVSEYVPGGTLAQFVDTHGRQPLRDVVATLSMLCDALAESHALGIVHRDVKPTNVLLAGTDSPLHPKLADFGIAKACATDAKRLRHQADDTALVAGKSLLWYSPRWAAPEQLMGDEANVRWDIYALGLVGVFMLTGRPLFSNKRGSEYAERKVCDEMLLDALGAVMLPASAVDVFRRACHFDPNMRPQSVEDFGDALREATDPTVDQVNSLLDRALEAPARTTEIVDRDTPAGGTAVVVHTLMSTAPVTLADREVCFAAAQSDGVALIDLPDARALHLGWTDTGAGWLLHIRPHRSLIRVAGKSPSRAIQLASDAIVEVTDPSHAVLARLHVMFGTVADGLRAFDLDGLQIRVDPVAFPDSVVVDGGAGQRCHVAYQRKAEHAQNRE